MKTEPEPRQSRARGVAASCRATLAGAALISLLAAPALALVALPAQAAPACAAAGATGAVGLSGQSCMSYEDFVHALALKALQQRNKGQAALSMARPASSPAAQRKPAPLNLKLDFAALDADRDGLVSLEEMKDALRASDTVRKLFKRLDANQDGVLDPAELLTTRRIEHQLDVAF